MKIGNFSATQILCEINFEDFGSSKIALFAVSKIMKVVFGKFEPYEIAKNHENLTS